MKQWIAAFILMTLLACTGCPPPPSPVPKAKIEVERLDSAEGTRVVVRFLHFNQHQNGTFSVQLNNPEEVNVFQEQVQFLLTRLQEAERQMNIHEQPLPQPQKK